MLCIGVYDRWNFSQYFAIIYCNLFYFNSIKCLDEMYVKHYMAEIVLALEYLRH